MMTVIKAQQFIHSQLDNVVNQVNSALKGGRHLDLLKESISRLGRGTQLPHWYQPLFQRGILPNLDGKSLGSVLEMIFVATIETNFLQDSGLTPLRINPARGVDIPDLRLGIKSPSENYCTSEPFFSAYERLLGNEHDAIILLTDYQTQKKNPPLRIQIIKHYYLRGSQIADKNLCVVAKRYRDILLPDHETELKKLICFLAYVNQSDHRAKILLKLLDGNTSDRNIDKSIQRQLKELEKKFSKNKSEGSQQIYKSSLLELNRVQTVSPRLDGLIKATNDLVITLQKDFGRYPNDNEWERFLRSPLDGEIGMSYALQWRYNFGQLFKVEMKKNSPM